MIPGGEGNMLFCQQLSGTEWWGQIPVELVTDHPEELQ
jgi:hypothetical protein